MNLPLPPRQHSLPPLSATLRLIGANSFFTSVPPSCISPPQGPKTPDQGLVSRTLDQGLVSKPLDQGLVSRTLDQGLVSKTLDQASAQFAASALVTSDQLLSFRSQEEAVNGVLPGSGG